MHRRFYWQEQKICKLLPRLAFWHMMPLYGCRTWFIWSRSDALLFSCPNFFYGSIYLLYVQLYREAFGLERKSGTGEILWEIFSASGMSLISSCVLTLVQSSLLELKYLKPKRDSPGNGEPISYYWNNFTNVRADIFEALS